MAERDIQADQELKEARKLRELFKGRFSDEEALELLKEYGGLSEAVDFVLNGDPSEVRKLINERNETFVAKLQRDSEYVQASLEAGLEASVHLFACQPCDRYWWRKVPARKEVSKCHVCKVKYEPVPRHEEWGLGEFVCECGHVFFGSAWMSHTKSPCYKCGFQPSPRQILPPTRSRNKTNFRSRHSCNGRNCYNRACGTPDFSVSAAADRDKEEPICPHEQSVKTRRVLFPSPVHISTGSTVGTFMSQGELAEDYEEVLTMPRVPEEDED